jgi:YfdX protein
MSLLRKAMLVCVVGFLATGVRSALADAPAIGKTDARAQDQVEAKRKTLMADAIGAISETRGALKKLDDGKKQEALAALERATGKLDIILARDPTLKLAPAEVSAVTVELQGGVDVVRQLRKQAVDLIGQGRVQEARRLLKNLASETVVTVANIPLATYPAAIKEAVKLIDDNKIDAAKRALQTALNTQVLTETIIPLPVINAQESLRLAETLAEKKDRTKEDSANLTAYLEKARGQLELAHALGYGTKRDFDPMYLQLTEVEEKTADNKFGTGFFAKIKSSIADFMKSSQPSKP